MSYLARSHAPVLAESDVRAAPSAAGTAQVRLVFLAASVLALTAGFVLMETEASARAVTDAGPDLVRLVRSMALIKLAVVAAAVWLGQWRLSLPVSVPRAVAYIGAAALMCAGPGVMWNMEQIGAGAVMLHGGLIALIVIGWGDQALGQALSRRIPTRRRQGDAGG